MTNNNNLNSLRSLTEFFGEDNQMSVVVPKIQRAYAQGRSKEENLRTQFVNELFNALEIDEPLELSFVYGSKNLDEDGAYRYELLDGQQRITTLMLVYWYLASAERKPVPPFIKSFTYETRTTSSKFLDELSHSTIKIDIEYPSKTLRQLKWYTLSFDKDSSVNGMMNMLDAIHHRYIGSSERGNLYYRLHNLKFYELDLKEFKLTEEIYVKMNARGLQLTPFENFKADLVKFMKRDDMPLFQDLVEMEIVGKPLAPYYLNFSQKLDNRWLNLFWHKEDKTGRDYCTRYFRFFYRYFASKCFLDYQKALTAQEFRPKSEGTPWNFFWELSPLQNKTYFGFKFYEKMLEYQPKYIKSIECILDWFSIPNNNNLLNEELSAPWDKEEKWYLLEEKYRLPDAVLFTAICEYIERSGKNFNHQNFRRWLRIVRNAIDDELFRNVDRFVSLSRNFSRILDIVNSTDDIYSAISTLSDVKDFPRSIRESIKKAAIITSNPSQDWESVFISAENHPFFAGSIGFLLHDLPETPKAFEHRAYIVGQMFDADGMTEISKLNSRLIRAFVRQLNTWEDLRDSTITERKDKDNHLRAFLLEKDKVGAFLCNLGDMDSIEAVFEYIDSFVDTEPEIDLSKPSLFTEDDPFLERAYTRLCVDTKIYQFIRDVEATGQDKFLDFMYRNNDYVIHRRRSWWDRIYLGTDRRFAIKRLLELGFSFWVEQEAELDFFNKYGDVYEPDGAIWMFKTYGEDHNFWVHLFHNGIIRLDVETDDDVMCDFFDNLSEDGDENHCFDQLEIYDKDEIGNLTRKINKYDKLFKSLD
ncbi:MAG: DUF262 domain-containing protein [Muribaculaceae bacterium]|nr:DUF262 domain-containing protein [Muribaculaceae bacterium]